MADDATIIQMKQQLADMQKRLDKLETQGSPGQTVNATAAVSSGTGTVKMNGATSRNNTGWILVKDQTGTSQYVPYWPVITG